MVMDGPPDMGGRNIGPRPMELLLLGTGGCTSFDVVHILKKSRQQITDCVAEIEAERASNRPQDIHQNSYPFYCDEAKT